MGGHSPPETLMLPCDENVYRNIGDSLNLISQLNYILLLRGIDFHLENLNTIF